MSLPFKKILRFATLALVAGVGLCSAAYWASSHEDLAIWYKSLNPIFYGSGTWQSEFFTQNTKTTGNWWCLLALCATILAAWFCWKMQPLRLKLPDLEWADAFALTLIVSLGINARRYLHPSTIYTTDEVFSALNFGSLPFFQAISYYPKPNNHPFFNALNGLLFGSFDDLVFTGRMISLACYLGVLAFTFFFLKRWTESLLLRASTVIMVAFQFPIIGFAWQARGYEMVLLCSCLSLGGLLDYFAKRSREGLALHTVANVLGMFVLPSYLYWWAGLLVAGGFVQVWERKFDRSFLKASFIGFTGSLVVYLPLLCFSGLGSLAENKYVEAAKISRFDFIAQLNANHYFDGLFYEWFCASNGALVIGLTAFILPILLFIKPSSSKERQHLAIVYYSMIFAFMLMAVIMLRLPFYRNLIAHGYLILLVPIIALFPFLKNKWSQLIFALATLVASWFFIKTNKPRIPDSLYYYHAQHVLKENKQELINLDLARPIFLDDEAFYWWYVLQEKYPNQPLDIRPNMPKSAFEPSKILPQDTSLHRVEGIFQVRD